MSCPTRKPLCLPDLFVSETGQWEITILDQDDAAVNLAGMTVEMRFVVDGAIEASLAIGTGIQVTDEANGKVLATLATTGMPARRYEVFLIATDAASRVYMTPALLRLSPQPPTT